MSRSIAFDLQRLVAVYPNLSKQEQLQRSRRLSKEIERKDAFAALKVPPPESAYDPSAPVDLDKPSPCRNAFLALLSYNSALRLSAYDAELNTESTIWTSILRLWPAVSKWIELFHPRLGNRGSSRQWDLDILALYRTFYSVTCAYHQGRKKLMETKDALPVLLDVWLNYWDYAPTPASSAEWETCLDQDFWFLEAIARLRDDIPRPVIGHPDGRRIEQGLLDAAGGSRRKFYRKALLQRLQHIVAKQCIPTRTYTREALRMTQYLVYFFNDIRVEGAPRDIVSAIVQAWKDTLDITDGDDIGMSCAQLLILMHSISPDNFRYLAWAIRDGALELILRLVRVRDQTKEVTIGPSFTLMRLMRVQMIHRNFLRVLRRYGGSALVLRKDDPPCIRKFIQVYQSGVQVLDDVDEWDRNRPCYNPTCNADVSSQPEQMKTCECGIACYCSRRCQRENYAEHRPTCVGYIMFKPQNMRAASYKYITTIARTLVNQSRRSILADLADFAAANPHWEPKSEPAVVLVNFCLRNNIFGVPSSLEGCLASDDGTYHRVSVTTTGQSEWKTGSVRAQVPFGGRSAVVMHCGAFDYEKFKREDLDTNVFPKEGPKAKIAGLGGMWGRKSLDDLLRWTQNSPTSTTFPTDDPSSSLQRRASQTLERRTSQTLQRRASQHLARRNSQKLVARRSLVLSRRPSLTKAPSFTTTGDAPPQAPSRRPSQAPSRRPSLTGDGSLTSKSLTAAGSRGSFSSKRRSLSRRKSLSIRVPSFSLYYADFGKQRTPRARASFCDLSVSVGGGPAIDPYGGPVGDPYGGPAGDAYDFGAGLSGMDMGDGAGLGNEAGLAGFPPLHSPTYPDLGTSALPELDDTYFQGFYSAGNIRFYDFDENNQLILSGGEAVTGEPSSGAPSSSKGSSSATQRDPSSSSRHNSTLSTQHEPAASSNRHEPAASSNRHDPPSSTALETIQEEDHAEVESAAIIDKGKGRAKVQEPTTNGAHAASTSGAYPTLDEAIEGFLHGAPSSGPLTSTKKSLKRKKNRRRSLSVPKPTAAPADVFGTASPAEVFGVAPPADVFGTASSSDAFGIAPNGVYSYPPPPTAATSSSKRGGPSSNRREGPSGERGSGTSTDKRDGPSTEYRSSEKRTRPSLDDVAENATHYDEDEDGEHDIDEDDTPAPRRRRASAATVEDDSDDEYIDDDDYYTPRTPARRRGLASSSRHTPSSSRNRRYHPYSPSTPSSSRSHRAHGPTYRSPVANRPFPCPVVGCDHACINRNDLGRHMLKHDPPGWSCYNCRQRFTRRDALVRHVDKNAKTSACCRGAHYARAAEMRVHPHDRFPAEWLDIIDADP
ncbi:hypothetical protein K523DRAFT_313787 [Schizophyllum commune Tattone D]|nr:hypothetical protein K523DRAFT_313787 [Schizophyllum commune Tattone D]